MKIIILEGITTSGKTSIIKYISEFFGQTNYSFTVIGDDKTLMPILHNQVNMNTMLAINKLYTGSFRILHDNLTNFAKKYKVI
jgi:uridine kinase